MVRKDKLKELVPEHMHDGLIAYIEQGIEPGGFMLAVLSNDLKEAVARADHINIQALPNIVKYLFNYAPSSCWGSPLKVTEWIADFSNVQEKAGQDTV